MPDTFFQVFDGTAPVLPDRGPSALVVSACLLGDRCNYNAAASPRTAVAALAERYTLVAVCPEVAGGLAVPRPPAEIQPDGHVRTAEGEDVTEQYRAGAEVAVELARRHGAVGAVLKARSPSCGSNGIYDGTFTSTLTEGEGVTATALRAAGIEVVSEEDVAEGRLPGTAR